MASKNDLAKELIRREMLRREAKRKENVEIGEAQRSAISENLSQMIKDAPENIAEGAKDALITAPMGPTFGYADELVGLVDEDMGESYRQSVKEARERSPVATFMGEEGAQMAATSGIGLLAKGAKGVPRLKKIVDVAEDFVPRPGSLKRTAGEGALMGSGESDGDTWDRIINAGTTGSVGTVIHGAGRLTKSAFKRPKEIKGRMLGGGKRQYKMEGPRDFDEAVEQVSSIKGLERGSYKFNSSTGRYEKAKDGIAINRGTEPEDYLRRFDNAIDSSWRESQAILKRTKSNKNSYDIAMDRVDIIDDEFQKLVENSTDQRQLKELLETEADNLITILQKKKGLSGVNDAKRMYQNEARAIYGNPAKTEMDTKVADRKAAIARALRRITEESIEDPKLKEKLLFHNNNQRRHLILTDSLTDKIASMKGREGMFTPGWSVMDSARRGADIMVGGAGTQKARSRVGEVMGKVPGPIRRGGEDVIRSAPMREMTRLINDEGSLVDELMNDQQSQGRSPQSLAKQKVNFMLADTKLKRDTGWIKEHPSLVVGRMMQVAPDLAAQVQIALEQGNDSILRKTLPLMAQQVPELFEFDEYGTFDGKILDPGMRQMYKEKIMSDDNLDSYQRAQIINHLNRTNEVLK